MEKQGKILAGWAGATGGDGTEGGGHVGSLIDELMVKGVGGGSGGWNAKNADRDTWCLCPLGADGMDLCVCKFPSIINCRCSYGSKESRNLSQLLMPMQNAAKSLFRLIFSCLIFEMEICCLLPFSVFEVSSSCVCRLQLFERLDGGRSSLGCPGICSECP